jgi:pimeloyl-ACP methyl ester carboxylesterase
MGGLREFRAKCFCFVIAGLAAALSGCSRAAFYAHFVPYYFAGHAPKAECSDGPGFRYCLHRAPGGVDDGKSTLYFLHYAGGSEQSWSKIPVSRVYYAEFARRGLPPPRVVTISFGPYWTLFDAPGPLSPEGRFPVFVNKVIPFIEGKIGTPARRFIWGMSQGGLNAAELVLRRPDLWSGAVFSCPGWYTTSVFATGPAFEDYVRRTGGARKTVRWGMGLIRDRVASLEAWEREDPLERAKTAKGLPPVYIDCTREDEFGFYEGARLMDKRLRASGQTVTFREERGKHCELDARAAARFLAERVGQRPLDASTGAASSGPDVAK